jgi:amino-acid N-acetyltransferase
VQRRAIVKCGFKFRGWRFEKSYNFIGGKDMGQIEQMGQKTIGFRKAKMSDAEKIYSLVNSYANKGLMLPRSRSTIYENLREFTVAACGDELIGTGGLHIIWEDLAEIRTLAIDESHIQSGVGRRLVELLLEEAREIGVPKVFALTYQPGFFQKCGFSVVSKDELPQKVWKECINCPKFPDCDEIAVLINL